MPPCTVCTLQTDGEGNFVVFNMTPGRKDSVENVAIFPRGRRSPLTVSRNGHVVSIDCDLGESSSASDLLRICDINLAASRYREAVVMDERFLREARGSQDDENISRFLEWRELSQEHRNASMSQLGGEWLHQVWLNFNEPGCSKKTNLEFSARDTSFYDDNARRYITGPEKTILVSLKLNSLPPFYFLFIRWEGDELWTYGKNFFYNDSVFPIKSAG